MAATWIRSSGRSAVGVPGSWTARGDESFRSHWLAFPVVEFLCKSDPSGPPLRVQIQAGDQPAVLKASGGRLQTRPGRVPSPALVLAAPPPVVLGS